MPSIRVRDVILIPDETVRPPKPKFVMCVEPQEGWFYRINTKPWRPAVPLLRLPHHPFLDHDSFIECGDPLMLDDYIVDEALRVHGVIGLIDSSLCPAIICALDKASYLRDTDRELIRAALA